jgi:hypothetical protein
MAGKLVPPPSGWYYVTGVGEPNPGAHWINLAFVTQMIPIEGAGTKLIFSDRTVLTVAETIDQPVISEAR